MDIPRTNSRALRTNRNEQWSMDSLFHNSCVLGGLAFFWLLGSVVLLVGVIATMKLAYLPVLTKGFPSQVMGLTKQEALVMVSFAVTVHLLLLFLFLGMVLKERSNRNDVQVEEGPHELANTEGNQFLEEGGGTNREKEWDLPPCYECLVGEETPPPPFHSVILRVAHSSNSLSSQCQETWPCLSSKYQTPDAETPTIEDIELADDRNIIVERSTFEQGVEDRTDDANKPNQEQSGESKDETGNAVNFNVEQTGVLELESEDFVGLRVVVSIETSNSDSDQSEQTSFVQIFDDGKPDLDLVAEYKKAIATAGRINFAQDAAASGPLIANVVRLDFERIDVKDIADADETLLQHDRSVYSKFYPESQMGNLNEALLVDYTSNAVCVSLEQFESIEYMAGYVEDSAVQDKDPVEFHFSSDDELVKQQICERYATSLKNNDRQFIHEESEASCLNETECCGKRPADAVECCSQFATPINDSQRSALRHLKYNLDGSTSFLEHKSEVEIDDGSEDQYGDGLSSDTVSESKCDLFDTSLKNQSLHSEGLKELDTIDNSTFIDEDGIVLDSGSELFSVVHSDPGLKIDKARSVHQESITIGEGEAIVHCITEPFRECNFQMTKSHDVTCPTFEKNSQTTNRNKRAEPCRSSYPSSLERQNLTMRTTKKVNSYVSHNPIFALSGNQRSEYAFNTISGSRSRQKKSLLRELKSDPFSSCNSYRRSRNSNFNSHLAPLHQTSLLVAGKSASEALGSTYSPAVARIDFYPTFYFSQMDFNSGDIPYLTDVMESRESGIQSCSSLADSKDLERCDHTIDRLRQKGDLDSAVGSYGSIAMQSCASEPDDDDDLAKIV